MSVGLEKKFDSYFQIAIQARMGSSRFPGKVLASLDGEPLLAQQLRALQPLGLSDILIATSQQDSDLPIVNFCKENRILCTRGDEEDVLSRYIKIAETSSKDHIVRLTGDNPLISYHLLAYLFERHLNSGSDFTSTREISGQKVQRYLPKGWSVDIVRRETLLSLQSESLSSFDREHVIPPLYRMPIQIDVVRDFEALPLQACSIDTSQDLVDLQLKINNIGGFDRYLESHNSSVKTMVEGK